MLTTYEYDSCNRLKTAATDGGDITTYTHDAAGNRTKVEKPGGDTTYYDYDSLSRMVRAEPASGAVTFTYNADSQRVSKETPNGAVTGYLYDHKRLLQETDGVGGEVDMTYASATEEEYGDLISQDGDGGSLHHQFDAQKNTVALADPQGDVVARFNYHAFGEVASVSIIGDAWSSLTADQWEAMTPDVWETLPVEITTKLAMGGRKGYYRDEETELYLMGMGGGGVTGNGTRGRYYDPVTGRFTSEDPIRHASGDANLQRYVGNDPINNVDPSGNDSILSPDPSQLVARHSSALDDIRYWFIRRIPPRVSAPPALSLPVSRRFVDRGISSSSMFDNTGADTVYEWADVEDQNRRQPFYVYESPWDNYRPRSFVEHEAFQEMSDDLGIHLDPKDITNGRVFGDRRQEVYQKKVKYYESCFVWVVEDEDFARHMQDYQEERALPLEELMRRDQAKKQARLLYGSIGPASPAASARMDLELTIAKLHNTLPIDANWRREMGISTEDDLAYFRELERIQQQTAAVTEAHNMEWKEWLGYVFGPQKHPAVISFDDIMMASAPFAIRAEARNQAIGRRLETMQDKWLEGRSGVEELAGPRRLSIQNRPGRLFGSAASAEEIAADSGGGKRFELQSAQAMLKYFDVTLHPQNAPYGTPDFALNGSIFADNYAPRTGDFQSIYQRIHEKSLKYRDGVVVLNLGNLENPILPDDMLRGLDLANHPMHALRTLIIVKDDFVLVRNW